MGIKSIKLSIWSSVDSGLNNAALIDVLNSAGGSGNHDWMPPMLSLRVSSVVGHSHNASSILPLTERWNFSSSVLLEGSQATPTFDNPYVQVATARFSGLKIFFANPSRKDTSAAFFFTISVM